MHLAPVPAPRKPRQTFPPFITASSWGTVFQSTWESVRASHGLGHAPDVNGTLYPKLTNGEVVTLVMGIMEATRGKFPLWYQFAAAAYGWSPSADKLNTSNRQRDAMYPASLAVDLWVAWLGVTSDLDVTAPTAPRLALDGSYSDGVFQGQVRAALREDGAQAHWKIPMPACKDPKTGKPTGRPHKNKDGKWTCDPVVIDDPVTGIKKEAQQLLTVALIVGAIVWLLDRNNSVASRRKR